MSKKKKLIPELRFPEFGKDGEWVEKELGECLLQNPEYGINAPAVPYSDKLPTYLRITDISEDGIYLSNNKVSVAKDVSEENYLSDDEIVLARTGASVGKSYKYRIKDGELVFAGFLIRVRPNVKKLNSELLFQFLSTSQYWKWVSFISARSGQPGINATEYSSMPISLSPTINEQQKIASCLSSLDELIAAHSDKLDALKDHKKGLMQNLFPQEGQKVPNYRFPEFEDDGEWVEKKLGKIGEPLMCKRIFKDQTTPNLENGIPFYKIGTFGKEADSFIPVDLYNEFKAKYNFPNKGDILISASGTIGRLVIYDGLPAYFQDSNIVWLGHDEKQVTNSFLFNCYSIVNWQTSDGGVIKRLYNSDLKNISISHPENEFEQQKIASCLLAIDELITAQTEKTEQLQQHKKGLMQGLFPKIV